MFQKAAKLACILTLAIVILTGCNQNKNTTQSHQFTKIDSLTEKYLAYNDSIVQAWNVMINDDNQKLKSMRILLDSLQETNEFNQDDLAMLTERINQLFEHRYNPESLNEEKIEEYDFASNALVTEVTTLASEYTQFNENEKLQKLVAEIVAADQRVEKYRSEYDALVERYNYFLEINKPTIEETENLDWEKKMSFSY